MPSVLVTPLADSGLTFTVTVTEGAASTTHEVTIASEDLARLGTEDAATLIHKSFEFLLEREPKESILRSFDLSVIGRYFPEYEREIRKRL